MIFNYLRLLLNATDLMYFLFVPADIMCLFCGKRKGPENKGANERTLELITRTIDGAREKSVINCHSFGRNFLPRRTKSLVKAIFSLSHFETMIFRAIAIVKFPS